MNGATELILAVVWIVWAAYWLASAFTTKHTVERGGILGYRAVTVILVLGVLAVFRLSGARPGTVLWHTPLALAIICDLIAAIGAAFAIRARAELGRNWSAEVTFKEDHELIDTGPYALVRHPIYTGILTMALATALAIGRPMALAVFIALCGGFWWKARQEEEIMSRHFPRAYASYRTRVHAIVPFVL